MQFNREYRLRQVHIVVSVKQRICSRVCQILAAAAASLAARDAIDSGRAVSPLRRADGAVQVDGTFLTLEQVIETVVGIVREACAA